MGTIRTSIEIDAPAARVWQVITDTRAYDEWNPFITRVKGALVPGGRFSFMAPFAGRELPISAKMLRVEEQKELRWRGPPSDLLGKVFTGEHYFRLEPVGESKTRFVHGEEFGGVVVALLWTKLEPQLTPLYVAMNEALKRRVERN
jgi:hypothetical protein